MQDSASQGEPPSAERKKESFDEIVKRNAVLCLLGTAVAAFTAGYGAYAGILEVSGRTAVQEDRLKQLDKEAGEKEKVEAERDELRKELDIQTENLKKVAGSNTLPASLLQAGFWAYRQVDLKRKQGESFYIGDCPDHEKCYTFTIEKIIEENGVATVSFSIKGGQVVDCTCTNLKLEILEGKKVGIATSEVDFNIMVEADRISNVQLGVAIRNGSLDPDQPPKVVEEGFVVGTPANLPDFYKRWGFAVSDLPFATYSEIRQRIAQARTNAQRTGKILLIQFGANWCPDCLVLNKEFSEEPIHSYLGDHFELVNVDVGHFQNNIDIATECGVNISAGIPAAAFYFPDGTHITTTGLGELADARGYSARQILSFLQEIAAHKRVRRIN